MNKLSSKKFVLISSITALDTEEVYERNKWTIKDLEDIENISKDRKLENFIDDYEWDKREFTNLNLTSVLEEYKGKEEKQNYLKIRDKEISKEIEVFNSNYDKIENVMDALAKFEIRAEDIINELEKYNQQIEEIKEFEESYNPGFFDKYEKGLKVFNFIVHTTLDIVGMVPGIGWMADLANAGLYLVQGNYTAAIGSAISVVPGLGAAVKLSKGKKGLKGAEKGVEVAENNLNKAKKIRKNTKRKTKGPSSKLTSKYKQAVKNQNQAVKNQNQAKDVYKEAVNTSNKLKVRAQANIGLSNKNVRKIKSRTLNHIDLVSYNLKWNESLHYCTN